MMMRTERNESFDSIYLLSGAVAWTCLQNATCDSLTHSHHMKSSETANDDHWKSILLFFDCRVYVCISFSRSLWLCARRSGDERGKIDKLFVLPHDTEITHSNQHKHGALRQHEHCFTCQLKLLFIIERKFYVSNFVQFYGTWTPDACNN